MLLFKEGDNALDLFRDKLYTIPLAEVFKQYNFLRQVKSAPKLYYGVEEPWLDIQENVEKIQQAYEAYKNNQNQIRDIKRRLKLGEDYLDVYSGSDGKVRAFVPMTFRDGSRVIGSGTKWCTVGGNDYWDDYIAKGFMVYIIDMRDPFRLRKYNVHFDWDLHIIEHKDESDIDIDLNEIPINFNVLPLEKIRDKFKEVTSKLFNYKHYFDGVASITKNNDGSYNLVAQSNAYIKYIYEEDSGYPDLSVKIKEIWGSFSVSCGRLNVNTVKYMPDVISEHLCIQNYYPYVSKWDLKRVGGQLDIFAQPAARKQILDWPLNIGLTEVIADSVDVVNSPKCEKLNLNYVDLKDLSGINASESVIIENSYLHSFYHNSSKLVKIENSHVWLVGMGEKDGVIMTKCTVNNGNKFGDTSFVAFCAFSCCFRDYIEFPDNFQYLTLDKNCMFLKGAKIPGKYFKPGWVVDDFKEYMV